MSRAGQMTGFAEIVSYAREFVDVIVFARPPQTVQRALFAILAPFGRLLRYRALEPRYAAPHRHMAPEPWALAAAGLRPATVLDDHSLSAKDEPTTRRKVAT